jgi:hypothetical protein
VASVHDCDPLEAPSITLGAIVGVGKDADGTLYVDAENGIFVSKSGELVRQHVTGTGQSGENELMFSFEPPDGGGSSDRSLLVETQGGKAAAMALGSALSKAFLDESPPGITMLTVVDASTVSGMKVVNTPDTIYYVADVSNGNVLLVTEPMNSADWTPEDMGQSVFYGAPSDVAEREIVDFQQSLSGDGTLTFLVDGKKWVLQFGMEPAPDTGPLGVFTLNGLTPDGEATLDVTLRSLTPVTLPSDLTFSCFPSK